MPTAGRASWSAAQICAAACALLALALACWSLGQRSLDLDEAATEYWTQSLANVWRAVRSAEAPFWLYYPLEMAWTRLAGTSELGLRSASVLAFVLCAPTMFALGRLLFGPAVGALAALLFAVNPVTVGLAQTARAYSPAMLALLVAGVCVVRAVRTDRARWWLAFLCASVAGAGLQLMFALMLAPMMALAVWGATRRARPRRALATAIAWGLIFVVMARLITSGRQDAASWIEPFNPQELLELPSEWSANSPLLGLMYALGVVAALAPRHAHRRQRDAVLALGLLVLAPPLALAAYSALVRPSWVERYVFSSLAPLIVLVAFGLSRLATKLRRTDTRRARFAAIGAMGAVVVVALTATLTHDRSQSENWSGVVNWLATVATPDEGVVVHADYVQLPFEYYRKRLAPQQANVARPLSVTRTVDGREMGVAGEVWLADPLKVAALRSKFGRVWLVLAHDQLRTTRRATADIQDFLLRDFALAQTTDFGKVKILRFDRIGGG